MSLDNISGILDSATNLTKSVGNTITDLGSASSLSTIVHDVTGVFSSLSKFLKTLSGTNLPLPNPLNAYATYDYILTLACLSKDEVSNPDSTYMSIGPKTIICKSAGISPSNRVNTAYGQFEFYFENLQLEVATQLDQNLTSNYDMSFTVLEPYSIGLFFEAIQVAADSNGWDNWRNAPFLIQIDFRGNQETGTMTNIQGLSRFVPFTFVDFQMNVTHKGATYACKGMPANMAALVDNVSMLSTDISSDGSTVAEILQYGDNSLQYILNAWQQDLVAKKIINVADQYLIYFPNDSSSAGSNGATGAVEDLTKAIADPITLGAGGELPNGVTAVGPAKNPQQSQGDINEIGQADMGFDEKRPGDSVGALDDRVYDNTSKTFFGGKIVKDASKGTMVFDQKTNIPNAINQVILQSNYVKDKLDPSSLTAEGYRGWWSIRAQVFPLTTKANSKTGQVPNLYVYRVLPYLAHASRLKAPGYLSQGLEAGGALSAQAVKQYDYIYTGKNDNILDVKISLNNAFMTVMPTDAGTETSDLKTGAKQGSSNENAKDNPDSIAIGGAVNKGSGATSSILGYVASLFKSDAKGGGGVQRPATRAAKAFQDAMSDSNDIIQLNMTIMGDPYYLAHSGLGNYSSSPTQYVNLNADGTMNYEGGEVDIVVNFRTPLDINQTTGMYDFGNNSKTAPVIRFSGLYYIITVTNIFTAGKFTQVLHANRRADQESEISATSAELAYANSVANDDPQNPIGATTGELATTDDAGKDPAASDTAQ